MNQPILTLSNGTMFKKNKKGIGIRAKRSDWMLAALILVPTGCFFICIVKGAPILIGILVGLIVGFVGDSRLNPNILFLNTKNKKVVSVDRFLFIPFNQIKIGMPANGGVIVFRDHPNTKSSIVGVIDCSSCEEQNKVMDILNNYLKHS